MICPECKGLLAVEHYTQTHTASIVLSRSRLKCTNCKYVKEGKVPDKVYSEMFPEEVTKIWK